MSPCEPVSSVHLSFPMMLSLQYLADAKPLLYFPHPFNLSPFHVVGKGTRLRLEEKEGVGDIEREGDGAVESWTERE